MGSPKAQVEAGRETLGRDRRGVEAAIADGRVEKSSRETEKGWRR